MTRMNINFALASFSSLLMAIVFFSLDATNTEFLLSMSTAYCGLVLLAITLLIGPINLIRGKKNPISSHLRRDVGIWAAIISLAHVFIGLQEHFSGHMLKYFFYDGNLNLSTIRFDMFGLANYTGLVATVIFFILMLLSNNISIKKLGGVKWKSIQKLNYLSFLLVIAHAIIYPVIGSRFFPFLEIVGLVFIVVLWFQWKGYRIRS